MFEHLYAIICLSGISVIALAIAFVAITYIFILWPQQQTEKRKAAWKQLAAAHNLNFFSSDSFLDNGYVTGNYQGYELRLETYEENLGRGLDVFTKITVSVPQLDNHTGKEQVSFQDSFSRLKASGLPYESRGEISATQSGKIISYKQRGMLYDVKYLENIFSLLAGFAEVYPAIVNEGSEAISDLKATLKYQVFHPIIIELLLDIAQDTTERFAYRVSKVLCPQCLTRFGPRELELFSWNDLTYYGCRTCGQSRKYLEGTLIAVLDNQRGADPTEYKGVIRVNWSTRRELFDFEGIEIINATDEEVERFAMQVGNDTDELRKPRYNEMTCLVNPQCGLSENPLRILRRMFGRVVIKT